jgi:hypothetical protein
VQYGDFVLKIQWEQAAIRNPGALIRGQQAYIVTLPDAPESTPDSTPTDAPKLGDDGPDDGPEGNPGE